MNRGPLTQEDQPWGDWLAELQSLLGGKVVDFLGWGACYGAGLTPAQAIACRDHGDKKTEVENYWSFLETGGRRIEIGRFELNFGQVEPGN